MEWLGYSAINLGPRDLMNGGEYVKELENQFNIEFLSANIFYTNSQKQFANSSIIKKIKATSKSSPIKDLKVGILGLCDNRKVLFGSQFPEQPLESREPLEIAKEQVPKLLKKSDLVILLYHGKYSIVEKIAKEVEGIDVIIMGGEYYRAERSKIEKPIVVSTSNMGKYLGALKLEIDKDKNIKSHTTSKTPLKEDIQDSEKYLKLAEEFELKQKVIQQAKNSQRSAN